MDILDTLAAIAEILIYSAFMLIMLPRRFGRATTYIAIALLALLNSTAYLLPQLSWFRTLLGFSIIAVLVFALFEARFSRRLLLFAVVCITMIINEFVFAIVFLGTDTVASYSVLPTGQRIVIAIAYRACLILLFITAARLLKPRLDRNESDEYDSGLISSLPVCAIPLVMIIIWYRYVITGLPDTRPVGALLPLGVCILAEAALILLQRSDVKQKSSANELRRLRELMSSQQKYYSALTDSYNETRKMRHDIQNHIFTIRALLIDRKIDEAEKYTDGIRLAYNRLDVRCCEHSLLDSYLFYRVKLLRDRGIEPQLNIAVPESIRIDGTDLISTFGNLLDNAEEACLESPQKSLSLTASIKDGVLFIDLINSFSSKTNGKKPERIPGLSRGVGSLVLSGLAEKYRGYYGTEIKDEEFHTFLALSEVYDA